MSGKRFETTHIVFKTTETFTEENAPDWLTCINAIKGSTMDASWFWTDHVLALEVGETAETEFHTIRRAV